MKQLLMILILVTGTTESFSQARPFTYGADRRRYTVYLPAAYQQNKGSLFPLVFNFHGGGMTMTEQMFYSKMNEAAERFHFIVVYPQGIRQDWNVGFDMPYQRGTDDVGFVKALLLHLQKELRVDSTRVYATGLSRGGFFCHRLAAELPEKFAAIASVGGPLPDSVAFFHKKQLPVSVMLVHGDADEVVQYEGKKGAYFSQEASYGYWKKINGLENAPERMERIDLLPDDSTAAMIRETTRNGTTVQSVSVLSGGHTWPGSDPFNIGFDLGRTTQEVDLNSLVWAFFKKHRRTN